MCKKKTKKHELTFDHHNYATKHNDYLLWIDLIYQKINLPWFLPAFIYAIIPFIIGLLVSILISFQKTYLSTLPFYIGIFGITWVLSIGHFGSKKFHTVYEDLRPCLLIDDESYSKLLHKWCQRMQSHKRNLIGILVLSIIALIFVYITFFQPQLLEKLNVGKFTKVFSSVWFSSNRKIAKSIILGIWGIFVAFPLATASRLLIFNFLFLLDLRNLPIVPITGMIKSRFWKLNNYYIQIAICWFIGVGLIGFLLFDKLDIVSIISIGILSLIGTLTFLTPQFLYRQFINKSNLLSSKWVLRSFYKYFDIKLIEEDEVLVSNESGANLSRENDLKGFIQISKQYDKWVYDPTDIVIGILGNIIPFLSVYITEIIEKLTE